VQRTVRTLQRLALAAGFCAAAWVAAEGLDHGTAWADDVPVRIEQERPSERPGGLLDELLDSVLPDPPADDEDNGRGDGGNQDPPPDDTEDEAPERPAEPTPEPDPEPEQTEEPERPRPIEELIEDVVDVVIPGPVGGDDGSPQLPVDPPPAPVTEPPTTPINDPEPEPVVEQPGTPTTEAASPTFGGEHQPAPWTSDLTIYDSQTDLRTGGLVCGSRDDDSGTGRDSRTGASIRDRLAFPRGLAGPGLVPLGAPCDPDEPVVNPDPLSSTPPPPTSDQILVAPGPSTRLWVLDYRRDAAMHDRYNDALPTSRLTLWPPGPG
jgi:hypothetical protein